MGQFAKGDGQFSPADPLNVVMTLLAVDHDLRQALDSEGSVRVEMAAADNRSPC
jgi:hypothetical protein